MKNEIRYASKGDHKKVRMLWDETFTEDSGEWRDWYFSNIYKPQNALLMFEGDNLISMSHNNPYTMVLNEKILKVSALAGVATRKDKRKMGYAKELIELCLKEAVIRGHALSFLYPFNYDFYRKFGYEQCYENKIYTANEQTESSYVIKEISGAHDTHMLYAKYTESLNGYIVRNRKYQQVKFLEHFADGNLAYLLYESGKAVGYALPEVGEEKVFLNELLAEDKKEAAIAFSAMYKKPVEYIQSEVEKASSERSEPHCMARILDVEKVFCGIPAKEGKIAVKILDNIIEKNNNTFLFEAKDGMLCASKAECECDLEINISQLAPVALGFKNTMDKKSLELFSLFFEAKNPWIAEVC